MKKVLLIAGCVLLCMVLVVALLAVFGRNDPDDPAGGGDHSMVYRAEDAFPTQEELQASMADLVLELKQGDELIFLSKRKEPSNSSAFSVSPMVYYTRVDD